MMNVIFEMETSDPDDFMTLLWLADHPDVDLLAVLVTPGSRDQCQLVRWALAKCGKPDIPVGAFHDQMWWTSAEGKKARVSEFHYKVYGDEIRDFDPGIVVIGGELLARILKTCDDVTVFNGCAPKCLHDALFRFEGPRLARWVQQGGFAGDNLVAPEMRLAKFEGKLTCPSFNPGGAPKETLRMLSWPNIERRVFVSKNVCHGVVWTRDIHNRLLRNLGEDDGGPIIQVGSFAGIQMFSTERPVITRVGLRPGLQTMLHGLDTYLRDKGVGKAMHDLVAAACVLDESVCTFEEVEIYRERGEWGARAKPGTNTFISVAVNMEKFIEVLAR